jgi:hypothetical protein
MEPEEDLDCLEFRILRVHAAVNLREVLKLSDEEHTYPLIAKAIGYDSPSMVALKFEQDYKPYVAKLRMLAGPNGYAVYRMLLEQQNG